MSHHILIVEDEETLLQFLSLHMENEGYRVSTLTRGGEILDAIERDPADLILLDLGLPDGDGLTRVMEIRKQSDVPIIVLTAREGDNDRVMALGLGTDDYMSKPCNPRELTLRVRNVLARSTTGEAPKEDRTDTPREVNRRHPSPPPLSEKDTTKNAGVSGTIIGLMLGIIVLGGAAYWYANQAPSQKGVQQTTQTTTKPQQSSVLVDEDIPLSPAEILGYGWIHDAQCGQLPDVSWWKYKSYEAIAGYVNRRYNNDWDAYIKLWVRRLVVMQDIYDRNSTAVTPSGLSLRGVDLSMYIDDLNVRVKVLRCLATVAAAHKAG